MRSRTARPPAAFTRRRRRASAAKASALRACWTRSQFVAIGWRVQVGARAWAERWLREGVTNRLLLSSRSEYLLLSSNMAFC
eukprot:463539-Heterocapsa_arctica.AAC.1